MGLLSVDETRDLHRALVDTYTYDALRTLVTQASGVRIDVISLAPNFVGVVTDVIQHAESNAWLPMLIERSSEERPGNAILSRLRRLVAVRSALQHPDPFQASRVNGAPMADRTDLRLALKRLEMTSSARVLVVEGGSVSGKSYTLSRHGGWSSTGLAGSPFHRARRSSSRS